MPRGSLRPGLRDLGLTVSDSKPKGFTLVGWDPAATQLSLRHAPDGRRYHTLNEVPLRRGEMVELLLPRAAWLIGTYDWDQDSLDESYDPVRPPIFTAFIGGPWEANDTFAPPSVCFPVPRDAVLRQVKIRRPRPDRASKRRR